MQAYEWTTFTDAQRATIKSQYAAAGVKLVVSAFGATDVPTTTNADPVTTANTFAAWVKKYNLDGIDVDYEVQINYSGAFDQLADSFSRTLGPLITGKPKYGSSHHQPTTIISECYYV